MNYILYISIAIGIMISAVNFYISFLAQYIEKKKIGSGIPILGSLLLFISLFFIKNKLIITLFILLDTGGIHWLIVFMIYYQSREK